jgi:endonuclease YncB( thermonuclease family)
MRARSLAVLSVFVLGILAGTAVAPLVMASRPAPPVSAPVRAPQQSDTSAVKGAYAAELLRVIDGDTFEARVHLWPGLAVTTKVRLRGIDAPEMHARCPQERSKAEAARDALTSILADGELTVLRVFPDKYGGRVVADAATARTPDVSAALLGKGMARTYSGGRRESWCRL